MAGCYVAAWMGSGDNSRGVSMILAGGSIVYLSLQGRQKSREVAGDGTCTNSAYASTGSVAVSGCRGEQGHLMGMGSMAGYYVVAWGWVLIPQECLGVWQKAVMYI